MRNILSVNFRLNRPEAFPVKGDKYLPKIIQNLSNLLRKAQKDFHYDTLLLPADKIRDLSQTLVEYHGKDMVVYPDGRSMHRFKGK